MEITEINKHISRLINWMKETVSRLTDSSGYRWEEKEMFYKFCTDYRITFCTDTQILHKKKKQLKKTLFWTPKRIQKTRNI